MSGFSKALVSIGVATGTLLKATGTLAKKSFNKAKDYKKLSLTTRFRKW